MRSFEEINEKISKGKVVVVTAEEAVELSKEKGVDYVYRNIDVVTTGTFAPMCSSGVFFNFGHTTPPMRMEEITLDGVLTYGGLAAVDGFLGVTQEFEKTGGAFVIEKLISGEDVLLEAYGKGTDCYPGKHVRGYINKDIINEFYFFNPRNVYQNYAAATNSSGRMLYTYMGKLLPHFGNVTYATSGELSPLLKDPQLETIGIGTKIFFGGTHGYVVWNGTQFAPSNQKIPKSPSRTLAVIGNAKEMSVEYIKAARFKKYGVTMFIGIGIPIPIIDEEIAYYVTRSNAELVTTIKDYGKCGKPVLKEVTFKELRSGRVELSGKSVRTSSITSLKMSRKIAKILKEQIENKDFYLTKPVSPLPKTADYKKLSVKSTPSSKKLQEKRCIECGLCCGYCDSIVMKDDSIEFYNGKCTNCGLCEDVCPVGIRLPWGLLN
ncbi:4Fe-4S binding protein [Thermosipho ferrireducens]|uniref:4Fe-4S binding protein n=1 Tax=Thermosipho ferrireducens TaxID=2571116 RepID=A0ABX7S8E9_9BACT|nr:homocysteine biosynthesis protein [Thermosipho ferrireducens]QTA37546.1 4Fe-4S binding protein [Thermosipho ferrireducens]